jgi:hypothetical protein
MSVHFKLLCLQATWRALTDKKLGQSHQESRTKLCYNTPSYTTCIAQLPKSQAFFVGRSKATSSLVPFYRGP